MARIIIASPASGQLEVEQSAFDAGFFPGYVYVRDAGPAASAEPSVEEVRVAGFVNGGGPLSTALRAAIDARLTSVVDNGDGTATTTSATVVDNLDGTAAA